MKRLHEIILEKLKIRKSNKPSYKYFPKTKEELKNILNQLIGERGNDGDFNDIDTSEINDMSVIFDVSISLKSPSLPRFTTNSFNIFFNSFFVLGK